MPVGHAGWCVRHKIGRARARTAPADALRQAGRRVRGCLAFRVYIGVGLAQLFVEQPLPRVVLRYHLLRNALRPPKNAAVLVHEAFRQVPRRIQLLPQRREGGLPLEEGLGLGEGGPREVAVPRGLHVRIVDSGWALHRVVLLIQRRSHLRRTRTRRLLRLLRRASTRRLGVAVRRVRELHVTATWRRDLGVLLEVDQAVPQISAKHTEHKDDVDYAQRGDLQVAYVSVQHKKDDSDDGAGVARNVPDQRATTLCTISGYDAGARDTGSHKHAGAGERAEREVVVAAADGEDGGREVGRAVAESQKGDARKTWWQSQVLA
mmetsp:Transcript_22721/g.40483  ORF Transcript_22721/g.40483 Transcript_22721/m.40483 type:complete len:320 (-) Transcript_22721:586-1545(-)